jgi:hypothetical protein
MAKKKVWLTWVSHRETAGGPEPVLALLNQYGFDVSGDYWVDDLNKMSWTELAEKLIDNSGPDLWIIAGNRQDLENRNNRYGLSMVSAMIKDQRNRFIQGICLGMDSVPDNADMPTLLRSFICLSGEDMSWPSKVVSAAYKNMNPENGDDFRFTVIAHPLLGQWFEVGPRENVWQSIMLGVSTESQITHHAVGARGQLPEKSLLEYPTEGIQAKLGEIEYTAWSVQNSLDHERSYFVKVEGFPGSVIIGGHPGDDTSEVSRIDLM